jgi:thymidylate synthase
MRTGFPLLTTKRIPLRWVFEELRWFLSGSTNNADLQASGVNIWDEWSTSEQCAKFQREEGDLGPVYGHLWRNFGGTLGYGFDQIAKLLDDILSQPNSRRLIVSGWHPFEATQVALPPCHTLWQVKCHGDSEMSLSLYARSIDIFLGLPFNIASYGLLLKMLSHVTGRRARELVISFGDLHLYNSHVDQANVQLQRGPHSLPEVLIGERFEQTSLQQLLAIQWSDIKCVGYEHHPKIEAPVAI